MSAPPRAPLGELAPALPLAAPDASASAASALARAGAARGDPAFARWVALAFAVVVAVALARHELWRDEVQAWLIARESTGLADLLERKRGEGHPDLWYLLLFGVSRLSGAPAAMQALHLAIATASAYVVARWAPFPRAWRVLVVGGYFLAFEYAVVSRGYALGGLALFAWCALAPRWAARPWATALALAVLANTSVFGALLAGAAALTTAAYVAARPEARRAVRARPWRATLAVLVVLAAAAWAAYAMAAPRAVSHLGASPGGVDVAGIGAAYSKRAAESGGDGVGRWLSRAVRAFGGVWRAYLPEVLGGRVAPALYAARAAAVCGAAALFVTGASLRRRPLGLAFFLLAAGGIVLFLFVVPVRATRHTGHLLLALLAALWVGTAAARPPGAPPPALPAAVRWVVGPLLLLQAAAAVLAIGRDLRRPFSDAEGAARFVAARGLDQLPIVASDRTAASGLTAYLGRRVFVLEEGRIGSYVDWERPAPLRAAPERLYVVADSLAAAGPVVLALTYDRPAPPAALAGRLDVRELARFTGGIQGAERFRLYLARRAAPGAAPGAVQGAEVRKPGRAGDITSPAQPSAAPGASGRAAPSRPPS